MTTVRDIKNGSKFDDPIYVHKPYCVLSKENVVLASGDIEHIKAMSDYYNECIVEVRNHDLYLNNNKKIQAAS